MAGTFVNYLLHCHNLSSERLNLLKKLRSIDESILGNNNSNISEAFLFGDHSFNDVKKTQFSCSI